MSASSPEQRPEAPENEAATYNRFYRQPNYFQYRDWLYRPFIRALIKAAGLKRGSRVLDVGCGQGFFTALFADEGMDSLGADILSLIHILIPKLCGAKVILDLHDPMPELMMTIFGLKQGSFGVRLLKRLEKWSIGFANAVLAVNVACRKIFSERSCRAGKVHVVMNSPDEGIFKYREAGRRVSSGRDAAKPFIIMYHGSLVERHGLDLAVTALKKIKRSIPKAELRAVSYTHLDVYKRQDPSRAARQATRDT